MDITLQLIDAMFLAYSSIVMQLETLRKPGNKTENIYVESHRFVFNPFVTMTIIPDVQSRTANSSVSYFHNVNFGSRRCNVNSS